MISHSHRFRGRKRINEVYRLGKPSRGELFNTRTLASNTPNFRVAIVVSKKVARSAVTRNRIRRKIYTCFHSPELKELESVDIIINVYSAEVAKATQPAIIAQLQKQLNHSIKANK